jgi:4-amino-4-deoxy-L-arabinose transferase-like glycosyltransferase
MLSPHRMTNTILAQDRSLAKFRPGKGLSNFDSDSLVSATRSAFWIIGPLAAATLAYTTRYFINGDAMTYIEIGESFINGRFSALANLTYSPGYPILLGFAESILKTNPLNELQTLKIVNFFCFLLGMAACEALMTLVRRDLKRCEAAGERPLPIWMFDALCYSMFLVAGLVLVRLRLLNPDMLILALVLVVTAVILRIRESPNSYGRYVELGLAVGIGYLFRSFFFVFSPVFLLLAAVCSESLRRAIPRVLVAVLVTLVISAPLIAALSHRLGRFTYGEIGRHVYALWISGEGVPIHPNVINENPKTVLYRYDAQDNVKCTKPSGFDNCYWYEGFRPVFNPRVQAPIIAKNVVSVFLQAPWLLLIGIWYIFQWRLGNIKVGPIRPPSIFIALSTISVAGTALYCLLNVEPRYIASFLFLGFVALVMSIRLPESKPRSRMLMLGSSIAMVCFLMGLVAYSMVDQSRRSLLSENGKLSYKEAFLEDLAVKDFLQKQGLVQGDEIAVLGSPPVNWARMAGVRIVAEAPKADQALSASTEQKEAWLASLRQQGIRAIVVKDARFNKASAPSWSMVPGTKDYFVYKLHGR